MRADALAQFLVEKRWTRWFVLQGPTQQDAVYAADVRRSATRFGARIVAARSYAYNPGSRRSDTGYQQIQTQMPLATQIGTDYDVLFVADETDLFGDYLPYNTFDARPVVGTRTHCGGMDPSLPVIFRPADPAQAQLFAHREMTGSATMVAGSPSASSVTPSCVVRTVSPAGIRAYLRSDNFLIAGFKGQGLQRFAPGTSSSVSRCSLRSR